MWEETVRFVRFYVHGIPKGQPRPRAFARGGKAHVFTPGTAEAWKGAIAMAIKPLIPGGGPYLGAISIEIDHYMPRPKSHYKTGKNSAELKSDSPVLHLGKPDIDNLTKAAMDAITHVGFWKDDAQVFAVRATKKWAVNGVSGGRPYGFQGAEIKIKIYQAREEVIEMGNKSCGGKGGKSTGKDK